MNHFKLLLYLLIVSCLFNEVFENPKTFFTPLAEIRKVQPWKLHCVQMTIFYLLIFLLLVRNYNNNVFFLIENQKI